MPHCPPWLSRNRGAGQGHRESRSDYVALEKKVTKFAPTKCPMELKFNKTLCFSAKAICSRNPQSRPCRELPARAEGSPDQSPAIRHRKWLHSAAPTPRAGGEEGQEPVQLRQLTGGGGSRACSGREWTHQGPRSKLQHCQRPRPKTHLSESSCVYAVCTYQIVQCPRADSWLCHL